MSQEVASQNPLSVEFTGANVASALFATFSESVVLNNGITLTRGDALKTFLDNMSYIAPERYSNVFWHGNKYGTPHMWGGIIYYCDLLATDDATRPLFEKICGTMHNIDMFLTRGQDRISCFHIPGFKQPANIIQKPTIKIAPEGGAKIGVKKSILGKAKNTESDSSEFKLKIESGSEELAIKLEDGSEIIKMEGDCD